MAVIRSWKQVTPYVGHESAIIWSVFRYKGAAELTAAEAPLEGILAFTLHMMQGARSGDDHAHQDREQVYHFTKGRGRMKLDGDLHDVKAGDAVHYHHRANTKP